MPTKEKNPYASPEQIILDLQAKIASLEAEKINSVKGNRICKQCGVSESVTLAKNPRYSFCKGICVFCYNKNRSIKNLTSLSQEKLVERANKLKAELENYQKLIQVQS